MLPVEKEGKTRGQQSFKNIKRGPDFLDIDIQVLKIEQKNYKVKGINVVHKGYIYDNSIYVFEFSYFAENELSEKLFDIKSEVNSILRERVIKKYTKREEITEEYTILLIDKLKNAQEFLKKNQLNIARFIRSLEKNISKSNMKDVLFSKISYSEQDVAIIDWLGSVLIDPTGDFDSQVELLKIGNYQLMRYRVLNRMIEQNLERIRKSVQGPARKIIGNNFIKIAIENKLSLLLDFDKVDQSLLLVGDWYTAKLYKTIIDELYLDDWKDLVKNRLDNLETIDATARENLTLNWRRILDTAQLVGWFVILIGYFIILLHDAQIL